jgi:serine/threonine protein kinase
VCLLDEPDDPVLLGRGASGSVRRARVPAFVAFSPFALPPSANAVGFLTTSSAASANMASITSEAPAAARASEDIDALPEEVIAVKSIPLASPEHHREASREFDFAARALELDSDPTNHIFDHIVRVRSVQHDECGQRTIVTMEYMQGGDVSTAPAFAPAAARSPTAVVDWEHRLQDVARDMCQALDTLHNKLGVLHRDLKPSNVLLAADGTAKIADFGVAFVMPRFLRPSCHDGNPPPPLVAFEQVGSASYMSPERLRGGAYGPTSDVWSLGVLLFQLALCGRHPFLDIAMKTSDAGPLSSTRTTRSPPQAQQHFDGGCDRFWCVVSRLTAFEDGEECEVSTAAALDAAFLVLNEVRASAPPSGRCREFLRACLNPSAHERPSAEQLLSHPWLA